MTSHAIESHRSSLGTSLKQAFHTGASTLVGIANKVYPGSSYRKEDPMKAGLQQLEKRLDPFFTELDKVSFDQLPSGDTRLTYQPNPDRVIEVTTHAAPSQDAWSKWKAGERIIGGLKAIGGGFEAAMGATLGVATSWTGVGAVIGGGVALHGTDVAFAGVRQAISGEETSSFTSQGLEQVGLDHNTAEWVDTGISIGGSLGAGGLLSKAASKVAPLLEKTTATNLEKSVVEIEKIEQSVVPKIINSEQKITTFVDRAAARQALVGDQQAAANRFFRGATSKSTQFKVIDLESGMKRMEFFSPANNPGYGKLYVQEIDSSGTIIKEFKETLGPQGLIDTKWIYGKPNE